MADIPPRIAREIVLRHLPRPLRAGLDADAASGGMPARLAAEAEAVSPGTGALVAAWIRENVGECVGLAPGSTEDVAVRRPDAGHDPVPGMLDALDRAAVAGDAPVLREVVDSLILLAPYDRVASMAARSAATVWEYLDRMPEVGATLHQLALASARVQAHEAEVRPPWPGLDADGLPAGLPRVTGEEAEAAWRAAIEAAFEELRREARTLAVGLSTIAGGRPVHSWALDGLARVAIQAGLAAVEPLNAAYARESEAGLRRMHAAEMRDLLEELRPARAPEPAAEPCAPVPPGHVVVCPPLPATGPGKGKDVSRGYDHVVGRPMPLVPTPDLSEVRRALAVEFPYATRAVDATLGAFAGRPHVHAPPLLVVGPPGSGKTRFVRRLGETLGVGILRFDGSGDGGASFGGTERRWFSSEPCRALMAVAKYRQANPIIMVDEVDKAPTRTEYGRLWDSLLQALCPETAARFPDPCFQVDLDLSWVTVISTANGMSAMPGPLLDRMQVVRFPEPGAEHLDVLLPSVLAAIAEEAGFDPLFLTPLDGIEREALRRRWRGGSVRRLRRAVEAVLRVRDRAMLGRAQ